MPEILVKNLCFSYRDCEPPLEALRGASLRVAPGELVCVLGPSGCGKSTLLRLIAGLERPRSGELLIDGRTVTGPGPDRMIVFQDYALFPWLTVEKNVSFALRKGRGLGKREAREKTDRYLEKVGLSAYAGLYPFQLSGGMRQRVAIARALAMDTEILLLDEPFAALDAKLRQEMQQFLLELWRCSEKTVVFVTHDIDEALLLSGHIVFMSRGQVRADLKGTNRASLLELFEEEDQ